MISEPIDFLGSVIGTRSLVGLMNFLMWFGNTTIMLMAAIMGISQIYLRRASWTDVRVSRDSSISRFR